MSAITDKQNEQRAIAAKKRAEAEADMMAIAKHFDNPEGMKVLELLMRRSGVLAPRFTAIEGREPNALRAARRDGQADTPLFIIDCLKLAGAKQITFPL